MKISILTLFPEMFNIFNHSIIGKAQEKGLISINTENIRDYTLNKHKKVDDYPYGGGAGMVMAAQPVVDAIRACRKNNNGKVIFLGPKGKTFNQKMAEELSKEENLIFLCGHYEGIDERAFKEVDLEIIELGKEALDKIRGNKRYDLILLDDDIKPLSGLIIMKKLFMIKSFNTKVILLTKNNEYKDSYKEYGFSDVILKPIDEEIFNNIIDKYLK